MSIEASRPTGAAVGAWQELLAITLLEGSPFATAIYDAGGQALWMNAAFEKQRGQNLTLLPADYSIPADPEFTRQGILPAIARAFDGESVAAEPTRCTTSDGNEVWTQAHFHPVMGPDGEVRLVVLTQVDLTDHIAGERTLRRTLSDIEHLQSLTAELAVAGSIEDVGAVVLERALPAFGADAGLVTLLADSGEELVNICAAGFDERQLLPFRRYPLSAQTVGTEVIRTGLPVYVKSVAEAERRFPVIAGTMRAQGFQSFAALPLSAKDRTFGVVAFNFRTPNAFDAKHCETMLAFAGQCAIALERARLYEAERVARAAAEQANRSKAGILANMSHELRTPLNAIDGYAELIELGIHGALTDDQREALRRIRRSQKHLLALIDDLLGFARLESGRIHIHPEPVFLEECIATAVELVQQQALAKQLTLTFEEESAHVHVMADREKLHQVVLNLLSNAVKFTESGTIKVAVHVDGARALVDITDTGRGIPADQLEEIFQPFVQVERGLTRNPGGTGLGLAIARDLARRMNGDISVTSVEGDGSTFTLALPIAN